jgi:hypothetical protein
MTELIHIGAEYVCLMPYSYMNPGEPKVIHDTDGWQWWGECKEGIRTMCQEAQSKGLSVMIKPHLWIGNGDYTGSLIFENNTDQQIWNESYRGYLIQYARMSEELNVEILCIGTELCAQVDANQGYWTDLIAEVRSIYSGKLTYAANWDCYPDFPLWGNLDYIGIDAYFPLASMTATNQNSASEAWNLWKPDMIALSDSVSRPVLFTEYGYRSCEGALVEPWTTENNLSVDENAQVDGYRGLYSAIWSEPWFAGGFLWKWHCKEHIHKKDRSTDFTPQDKPALHHIKSTYGAQSIRKGE